MDPPNKSSLVQTPLLALIEPVRLCSAIAKPQLEADGFGY